MESILFLVSVFFAFGYAIVLLVAFVGFFVTKSKQLTANQFPMVSVVLPVRNEENNIRNCIDYILKQNYPKFEVIVVDDCSSDDTYLILQELMLSNPNKIKLYKIEEKGKNGKKAAIAKGIENAKAEIIVTTDADCTMGQDWLASMVVCFQFGKYKMVSGPVLFLYNTTLLSFFQQIEQLGLIGMGAGFIRVKMPFVCSGANLLYEKSSYKEVAGFDDIDKIPSGDDVMLMQKFEKEFGARSIGFVKNRDAVVYTKPVSTFKEFLSQRTRWAAKILLAPHFVTFIVSALSAIVNMLIVFWCLFIVIYPQLVENFLLLLSFKAIFDILLLFLTASFFKKKTLVLLALPLQFLIPFYTIAVSVCAAVGSYTWKGREY